MVVSLTSVLLDRMASTHICYGRNQSSHHDRMDQPLYLTYLSEGIWILSLSLGGNLDLENTKLLPEVLKFHPSQWLGQHISYMFLHRNILELHYSLLHHNPDIVILDLYMLQLFMKQWIM